MTQTPREIEISKLHPFENHPFQVKDDENMDLLMMSIKENGVLSPVIVRPKENAVPTRQRLSPSRLLHRHILWYHTNTKKGKARTEHSVS